jgi:3'(2'), 5'-bisphosphate nucleotidase
VDLPVMVNQNAGELLDGKLRDVLQSVDRAAQLARSIQQHAPRAHEKHDKTPLTVADLAVQTVVARALEQASPEDALVAEEDASALSGEGGRDLAEQALTFARALLPELTHSDLVRLLSKGAGSCSTNRYWTLDPVDGTEGFLRAGHYVVSLALIEDYRPTIAMLGCPTLGANGLDGHGGGLVMIARRGSGAWIRPMGTTGFERVRVSEVCALRDARMLRSLAESHIDVDRTRHLMRAAGIERPPILMDSQAKHVAIAAGHADLLVRIPASANYREYIWDHAAGALVIEEAGGCLTDLDGRPLDFHTGRRFERNRGIVAANRHLHPLVLEVLRTCT